jgi:hypothetical protein
VVRTTYLGNIQKPPDNGGLAILGLDGEVFHGKPFLVKLAEEKCRKKLRA